METIKKGDQLSPLAISPEGDWVSSHPVADAEISVAAGEPITQSLEVKGQCAFELVKRRKNLLENEALQKYEDDQRAIELEFSQATKQAREDLSQAKKSALGGYDSATPDDEQNFFGSFPLNQRKTKPEQGVDSGRIQACH